MKKIIYGLAALLSLNIFASIPAKAQEPRHFDIGYNEDWFGNDYLFSLIKTFDINYVNKVFTDIKGAGGDIVRIYVFQARQGLILNKYAPQSAGVEPKMLANIESVLLSAEEHNLKVYFTLLDADAMPPPPASELRDYYFNLLHNKYGEQDAFQNNVLSPVLEIFNRHAGAIYGIDIANEIQAVEKHSYFGFFERPDGLRNWIKSTKNFIKGKSPWARITVTAMGPMDITSGLYDGLGLDFLDFHVYNDKGEIPNLQKICDFARSEGIPVIVGEFGQLKQVVDDNLQSKVTYNILNTAKKSCLSGAIPWRFDSADKILHYQREDGSLRPAADVVRKFKASLQE